MSGCVNVMDHKGTTCGKAKVDGSDFCATHIISEQNRCAYKRRGCGKMRAAGSDICPHHIAVILDEKAEREKRAELRNGRKAIRKDLQDSLKASPLRGYNPEFEESRQKKRGAYTQ